MQYIQPEQLGIYAPHSQVSLSREAEKAVSQAIFTYKQLFYGLRWIAWRYRDKKATFYEALSNGELEPYRTAPGRRAADGSYTKDEWDSAVNAYLWNRFSDRFDAAFNLEQIQGLKTHKDVRHATDELLDFALDNWGKTLLEDVEIQSPTILSKRFKFSLDDDLIEIEGRFTDTERTIVLSSGELPEVIVRQRRGEISWKGGVYFDTWGGCVTFNSHEAATFSRMLDWAARLNVGIKAFIDNPEGFLGLESAQARARNRQLMKDKLLQVNNDRYEQRKAQASEQVTTRRINEAVDAAVDETVDETVDAENEAAETRPQQPAVAAKLAKRQRQQEAADWLAKYGDQLPEDIDLSDGFQLVNPDENDQPL